MYLLHKPFPPSPWLMTSSSIFKTEHLSIFFSFALTRILLPSFFPFKDLCDYTQIIPKNLPISKSLSLLHLQSSSCQVSWHIHRFQELGHECLGMGWHYSVYTIRVCTFLSPVLWRLRNKQRAKSVCLIRSPDSMCPGSNLWNSSPIYFWNRYK